MDKLLLFFVLLCATFSVIDGHASNRVSIRKLERDVEELQEKSESFYNDLDNLETNLTTQVNKLAKESAGNSEVESTLTALEKQMEKIENKLNVILNELVTEKTKDMELILKSEKIIGQMKQKVDETETMINRLEKGVNDSVTDFVDKINEVNKSAHLTVNVKGVVFYGGVGSACSQTHGECETADSECRGGRCQCVAGLSFNLQNQTCTPACDTYGNTYQTVKNWIIRGYNNLNMTDITSLDDCLTRCQEETAFTCRSIDYFPEWKSCYFSSLTKSEVPKNAWEYSSVGWHFQRDCA